MTIASSTSSRSTFFLFFLAARSVASLTIFSRSAPLNPAVFFAIVLKSIPGTKGLFLACNFNISSLAFTSGDPTTICLSNLPGLNNAGSSISGLFVAAITIILSCVANPSISTSNWLRVCSLSSCPPPRPAPLWRPTASISSINIIHGELAFASLNISLTLEAPTPTNISTKSDPEILKKGTFASPATALASNVLPLPGWPTNNIPFGILAPISMYFFGFLRNSTSSSNSSFSSSSPATSLKVTFLLEFLSIFWALLLPKSIALELLSVVLLRAYIKINNVPNNNNMFGIYGATISQNPSLWTFNSNSPAVTLSCILSINVVADGSETTLLTFGSSFNFTSAEYLSVLNSILSTTPSSICFINSV